jgi:hypothetical protein
MTAFSAAIDVIFADPNVAADAVWRAQGLPPDVPCRVIRRSPDDLTDFGGARIRSETTRVDVRVSEIAAPVKGDRLTIGAEVFQVQGDPMRDTERLVWTLDLRPQ